MVLSHLLKCFYFSFTSKPPFYSRDTHEMYDNILHKPLTMRPGASGAAWSLLQGLLEKDGTHRLGSRDDFVSGGFQCSRPDIDTKSAAEFLSHGLPLVAGVCTHLLLIHNRCTVVNHFTTFPEWDQSTLLLLLHQLGWPCTEEDTYPIHAESGKYNVLCCCCCFLYLDIWASVCRQIYVCEFDTRRLFAFSPAEGENVFSV